MNDTFTRRPLSAEQRRQLGDIGMGLFFGAIGMWILLEIVPAFFDGRLAALVGGN